MFSPKQLEEIVQNLSQLIPQGAGQIPENIHAQIRATLNSGLHKMDLVTREEFDIQRGVLEKTREKLEKLEKKLNQLENSKPL
ncbi:accessory factor UbiK family protein [Thiomicrorhabdus sp. zzn3]|uniref:accessory factor UbiK family protein n=1 Tax=Thiomicrorhabdus sp. zzn3 TaxID=3039775 RepID=UPI0024367139|nr:accessory factor UbiK family protein [Thiomicrorhabdus sp. zzn3]MDG6778952.1 accessory factor UbiK family protein [Thiomicrorhabdus sp. zzn3]